MLTYLKMSRMRRRSEHVCKDLDLNPMHTENNVHTLPKIFSFPVFKMYKWTLGHSTDFFVVMVTQ